MFSTIRSRLSYANAIATVALFLALGGTSYALVVTGDMIADESVTARDLGPDSVRDSELANEVKSSHVVDDTLTGLDIDESTLGKIQAARSADFAANADKLDGLDASDLQGAPGPVGPEGPPGADGAPGPQGPPGISRLHQVTAMGVIDSEQLKAVTVACPAGEKVVDSGGYLGGDFNPWTAIDTILASQDLTEVTVRAHEVTSTTATWSVIAVATCAEVGQ